MLKVLNQNNFTAGIALIGSVSTYGIYAHAVALKLYLLKNMPTHLQFRVAKNLADALSQTNSFCSKIKYFLINRV